MTDQEAFQQWLGDPGNPELIERVFGQIEVGGTDPIEAAIAAVAVDGEMDGATPAASTPARYATQGPTKRLKDV